MNLDPSSPFASDRERRLWFWAGAVVVAIYSTLGPARALTDALRAANLFRISFGLILLLLVGVIVVRWVRRRPGWRDVGVALGVAFAYLMVWVRMDSWEERTHLIEYGIVASLIHQALLERMRNGRPVRAPAAVAVAVTAGLGLLDEAIQAVLPSRVFDLRDVGFNALAGFMVIAARLAIEPQHRPGWRLWFLWLMAGALGWGLGVYWGWFDGTDPKLQTVPATLLAGYLGVVVGGVVNGVLQWLLIRRLVPQAGWWALACVIALVVVGVVVFGGGILDSDPAWIAGVTLFGPVVGVLQWMVLRRHVPRAAWWVLASTAGWGLGMPFGDMVGPMGLGAVYGALTGAALVLLLRQPSAMIRHDPTSEHC